MSDDHTELDYTQLVDEAMRGVVRQALRYVEAEGGMGDHHFYVSFSTGYPGVGISPQLRSQYPEEMTIVLQHQFWDLEVHPHHFSVMLSFNNIPERLVVPFDALTAFADPSVRFGLQFHTKPATDDIARELLSDADEGGLDISMNRGIASGDASEEDSGDKVISLDAFRKP